MLDRLNGAIRLLDGERHTPREARDVEDVVPPPEVADLVNGLFGGISRLKRKLNARINQAEEQANKKPKEVEFSKEQAKESRSIR